MNRWDATTAVRRVPGTGRTGSIAAELARPFRQHTSRYYRARPNAQMTPKWQKCQETVVRGRRSGRKRFLIVIAPPNLTQVKNHASFESTHDTNAATSGASDSSCRRTQ
jgi:hypothetical protein